MFTRIPDAFYHDDASSNAVYGVNPTCILAVNQLINGKTDHWISTALHREKKQKKLILADWTARNWSLQKIGIVRETLKELMKEGFSIYMHQSGEIIPLSLDNLSCMDSPFVRTGMTPVFPDEMIRATVKQHHFSRDEIQVVDDYWMQALLGNQAEMTQRSLSAYDYLSLDTNERKKIIDVIKHSEQPLMSIIDDVNNVLNNKDEMNKTNPFKDSDINNLLTLFPHVQFDKSQQRRAVLFSSRILIAAMQTVDYSSSEAQHFFSQVREIRISLESSKDAEKVDNFLSLLKTLAPNLEILHLVTVGGWAPSTLYNISPECLPNLVEINLRNCKLGDNTAITLFDFEHIKIIRLDGDQGLTSLSFKELLNNHSYLEEIQLRRCELSGVNSDKVKNMNYLKTLEMSGIENPATQESLLKSSPNLTKLVLKSNNQFYHINDLPPESLLHVKEIDLSNTFIDTEILQLLRNAAPNVEKLILQEFGGRVNRIAVDDDIIALLGSFEHLKKIDFTGSKLTSQGLEKFLILKPNLERLNLSGIQHLSDDISLEINSLRKLRYINLNKCDISYLTRKRLMLAVPNIEEMILNNSAVSFEMSHIRLKRLKKLHFTSRQAQHNLGSYSTIAPNLETLYFNNVVMFESNLPAMCLRNVKKIQFTQCDNEPHGIDTILTAAPYIETLHLYDFSFNTQENFDIQPLVNLTRITLNERYLPDNKGIASSDLVRLLNAAPNLEEIELIDCANIKEESIRNNYPHLQVNYVNNKQNVTHQPSDHMNPTDGNTPDKPVHDHKQQKSFTPSNPDKPFQFKGRNNTKNQGMIIEKFCQYLTLTNQCLYIIPKLQDGICFALSYFFIEQRDKCMALIDLAPKWDGKDMTLTTHLSTHFNELLKYIFNYQITPFHVSPFQFLGDNLESYLNTIKEGCILSNPWHAIAITPPSLLNQKWMVYDPNYNNGAEEVNETELLNTIHTALGVLISVKTDHHQTPEIKDTDLFLEHGGLHALRQCANVNEMLAKIPFSSNFSRNALDGLLLRDTGGVPAWVMGIQSSHPLVRELTNNLLNQFRQKNPDHQQQLQRSMEAMSTYAKNDCITHIIQNSPVNINSAIDASTTASTSTSTLTSLIELIRTPVPSDWKRALQTWNKPKVATSTLLEYCQQCMQRSDITKRLIQLASTSEVTAMQVALQRYCNATHRPVFYIHSVEDLACKADFVKRDGDHGTMQPGPGGPLYDFLQSSRQGDAPILIVNYEAFHSSDIIRLNSLLDTDRKVDDVLLPTDALVIGLINIKKPDCYQGSDFYSRFNVAEQCPVSAQTLEQAMPLLPVIKKQVSSKPSVINLFHSPGWQTLLLGHWVLNENRLTFQEGALAKALMSGSTIEIRNGLWDDPSFQHFWRQACLQGFIEQAGRRIVIPRDLQLIKGEGHDWENLKSFLMPAAINPVKEQVLNPHRLNEFLNRYVCDQETNVLHQEDGIIKAAAGQSLPIYLTRTLSDDEWAMLLTECERHHVTLQVRSAPHVDLPQVLSLSPPERVHAHPAWEHQRTHTQIISSTDVDTTVAMLSAQENNSEIIDISACKAPDLLLRLNGKYDKNSREFVFSQTTGAVLQGLADNKNIILHGHFSSELADQLAPLLLERMKADHPSGELILVSDEALPFQYAPMYRHEVTQEIKLSCLGNAMADKLQPFIQKEPLSKLQARLDYWRMHADASSSDDHWEGMRDLKHPIPPLAEFNIDTCTEEARAFTAGRLEAVNQRLASAPYVFLSGLSGVGKSTFVTRELKQDAHGHDYLLHQGKDQIKAWVEDRRAGCKLLFLDEATLSSSEWSEFEGLFQHPPGILTGGKFYELSKDHKVIFAGNPLSYGDERKLASLFQRHGNALVFDPLPASVLYEKILNPVFEDTFLEEDAPALSKHFLDVYRFLAACSLTDVLITPRELEMMAQFTLSHCVRNRNENALDVAREYAFRVARNLVPESAQTEFDSQFKPEISLAAPERILKGDFLLTSSRLSIHQQLNELLDLRVMRKNAARKSRKYGGLGGIILEGEPGIGKSELVMHTLAANQYFKKEASYQPAEDEKIFYHMPVSWPLAEKENLLRKAFDEGSVVVIDEINSSPMMEELLNALLMGKTPEGKRPAHPGFMIIGTQNPVTMAGRRAPSTALSRRLMTACLPSYPDAEMREILLKKGLAEKEADTMISAFNEEVVHAQVNHLTPAPCFRDLLSLADNHIKAREVKMPEKNRELIYFSKNQRDQLFQDRPHVDEMFSEKKFLSEIKSSMKHAHSSYIHHQQNKDAEEYNRGYKTGLFSSRRHHDTGLRYAENFARKFDEAGSLQEAINILHELLNAEGVKFNTHSFSSYVMDEVAVLLKDRIIIHADNNGHYSRDDWANAKNTLENLQNMDIKPLHFL